MGGKRFRDRDGHHDPLGYLIPPGRVGSGDLLRGLTAAMEQRRFVAGLGVPSVPTRYVVVVNPADRAWFQPDTEDVLSRALTRHAERAGYLIVGAIEVSFEARREASPGRPSYWAGFAEDDLLVLADPRAALEVFARA